MRPLLIYMLLFLLGCSDRGAKSEQKHLDTGKKTKAETIAEFNQEIFKRRSNNFSPVIFYPLIEDTVDFIRQLKTLGQFERCWYAERNSRNELISFYKKVKINGSDKEYILLEYNFGSGAMVCFPYKYQFLFSLQGKLIATLNALRFDLLKIFPNQNPFLLTVTSTARGNGGHHLFKITADTLENIYEGYTDYRVQTYDAGENESIYEPNELKITTKDINADGYSDLVFSGKLVLIQGLTNDNRWYDLEVHGKDTITYSVDHPFRKLSIQYAFLYDPESGHFIESKKFSKGNPLKR